MAANDKEVLVKADHVKVYFKGKKRGQTVKAVDDVSFEIMKGETFGVVGESGCGKSTLGRTLIRLQQPTEGHIYLNGTDIAGLKGAQLKEMRKEAQIIFQDPSACLNPRRTIKQILMEPFEIHNLKGKIDVDAKIMELLQLVGLDSYHLSRYPHELSGGQKQRIGIARTLALRPEFIVCDEPISALDVSIQAQVINLLEKLQREKGFSYLFIAHDLEMVHHISHKIGVMYLGNMVELGSSDDVYKKPLHPYTRALISAAPIADPKMAKEKKRIILEGEVPSPINPPKGCPFAGRCKYATEECKSKKPDTYMYDNRQVACNLYSPKNLAQYKAVGKTVEQIIA